MLGGEIDVGIGAGEPHRKQFLAIPTIPPAHHPVSNLVRHLVVKPASALGKDHGSTSADLLFQLTQDRLAPGFANIDAALRHLPLRQPRRHADTAADEGQAVAVEQHDPYPRTVARKFTLRRRHHPPRPLILPFSFAQDTAAPRRSPAGPPSLPTTRAVSAR